MEMTVQQRTRHIDKDKEVLGLSFERVVSHFFLLLLLSLSPDRESTRASSDGVSQAFNDVFFFFHRRDFISSLERTVESGTIEASR